MWRAWRSGRLARAAAARSTAIDIDALLTAGDLEEYIVDSPRSPLPQLLHTERPDTFAMHLLDGRVGVLVDGLPVGFLLPADLAAFMRVPEDSATHFAVASMLTLLRWAALAISLLLPAAFVAISMYHQEMLPVKLLLSMTAAKQYVPFGAAAEVIAMLLAFELLQEAGLRLPDPVGQTASIIGALIVGQSAVEAKVVSPIAVIVVALAGICGYAMPSRDLGAAVRLGRLGLDARWRRCMGLYGAHRRRWRCITTGTSRRAGELRRALHRALHRTRDAPGALQRAYSSSGPTQREQAPRRRTSPAGTRAQAEMRRWRHAACKGRRTAAGGSAAARLRGCTLSVYNNLPRAGVACRSSQALGIDAGGGRRRDGSPSPRRAATPPAASR